jgi:hypothetical protein
VSGIPVKLRASVTASINVASATRQRPFSGWISSTPAKTRTIVINVGGSWKNTLM